MLSKNSLQFLEDLTTNNRVGFLDNKKKYEVSKDYNQLVTDFSRCHETMDASLEMLE
jgi:hypothetical protein